MDRKKKNKDEETYPNIHDTSIENSKIASQAYCSCLDTSFSRYHAGRGVYSSSELFTGKPRHLLKNPIAVSTKCTGLFSFIS